MAMGQNNSNDRPIGVFDSGVGGLTVLKSIHQLLPAENLLYLGDTARLPYGTKSARSVLQYAQQAAAHLQQRDIKLLVVACNTASAVALPELQQALAPLPVIGVVEPGAQAAVKAAAGGNHVVLATEATVALGAYGEAIRSLDPAATVQEQACELLVALAEEGWTEGQLTEDIVSAYLQPLLSKRSADESLTLLLGCTHFPILRDAIAAVVGSDVTIVDSASTTAEVVRQFLQDHALARYGSDGTLQLLATDGARRFARVGGAFLDKQLQADDIELIDL